MNSTEIDSRLKRIKLVLLDVDGVLTNGHISYGDYGDELKSYDIHDGLGIELLREGGIKTVVLSGRKSRTNARRAKELKISLLVQGVSDKLKVFVKILKKYRLSAEDVCCMGDDLVDIPLLKRAGFAVAVQNAVPEVKVSAQYVTKREGGRGAVREIADKILKSQGRWEAVTARFYS